MRILIICILLFGLNPIGYGNESENKCITFYFSKKLLSSKYESYYGPIGAAKDFSEGLIRARILRSRAYNSEKSNEFYNRALDHLSKLIEPFKLDIENTVMLSPYQKHDPASSALSHDKQRDQALVFADVVRTINEIAETYMRSGDLKAAKRNYDLAAKLLKANAEVAKLTINQSSFSSIFEESPRRNAFRELVFTELDNQHKRFLISMINTDKRSLSLVEEAWALFNFVKSLHANNYLQIQEFQQVFAAEADSLIVLNRDSMARAAYRKFTTYAHSSDVHNHIQFLKSALASSEFGESSILAQRLKLYTLELKGISEIFH